MPNRWIGKEADEMLDSVISDYKKRNGLDITKTQAIEVLFNSLAAYKGDEKQ
jgi:hypothetical protein